MSENASAVSPLRFCPLRSFPFSYWRLGPSAGVRHSSLRAGVSRTRVRRDVAEESRGLALGDALPGLGPWAG